MTVPSPWVRHAPFLLFMVLLFGLSYYLQQNLELVLPALTSARILMQLAVGATVIAILRNVVGIQSYGTFAPVIIALSFLYTGLLLGLLLFAVVMLIMILTRATLQGQQIQQSHRAAIMILLVAITAILFAAFASSLGQPEIAFVLLFPVVITAWFADRFMEHTDRVGLGAPTKVMLWTLVLVAAAYVVMVQAPLVDLLVTQPLTWPALVLLHWFLGTRIRIRVSDKMRFGTMRRLEDVMLRGGVSQTVLTVRKRNAEYLDRYNPPHLMASLNKAKQKAQLLGEGIPVPDNYLLVARKEDIAEAMGLFRKAPGFAVKPAEGFGGEGIIIVHGSGPTGFRTSEGRMTGEALMKHLALILDGAYNDGRPDEALVEALVETHPALRPIAPQGVPDIRVICFQGYPVMAMIRLPTRWSGGKANLHLGAVGAGVEIASGAISFAVWKGEVVRRHPDTGRKLLGFQVPFWGEILEIASEAQRISGLGFAGVDIVLDELRGPLVLEVNRRPGLEIQKANGAGLVPRLEAIAALGDVVEPPEVRVLRVTEMDRLEWRTPPKPEPGKWPPAAEEVSVRPPTSTGGGSQ